MPVGIHAYRDFIASAAQDHFALRAFAAVNLIAEGGRVLVQLDIALEPFQLLVHAMSLTCGKRAGKGLPSFRRGRQGSLERVRRREKVFRAKVTGSGEERTPSPILRRGERRPPKSGDFGDVREPLRSSLY